MELKICHMYPDVLNLYGDRGNVMCMTRRLQWRGIETNVTKLPIGAGKSLSGFDLVFIGGGQDFDGKNAANKDLFGGGSGAGVNIQPVAFLVIKDGCVRTIQLSDGANTVDRALTMIPELVEKVSALIDRKGGKAAPAETDPEAPNA